MLKKSRGGKLADNEEVKVVVNFNKTVVDSNG